MSAREDVARAIEAEWAKRTVNDSSMLADAAIAALRPHIDAEIAAAVAKREAEIVAWLRAIDTADEIVNLTCPMHNSDMRDALLKAAEIIERRGDHEGNGNG